MRAVDYGISCDVVGAVAAPVGSDRAIVVRPRDVAAVVRQQGGAAGALAMRLVPETVANEFFARFATELRDGMRKNGVDADVYVTAPAPPAAGAPARSDFLGGALVGAGGAAALYGIARLIQHLIRGRR